jgi:hypothetical protein
MEGYLDISTDMNIEETGDVINLIAVDLVGKSQDDNYILDLIRDLYNATNVCDEWLFGAKIFSDLSRISAFRLDRPVTLLCVNTLGELPGVSHYCFSNKIKMNWSYAGIVPIKSSQHFLFQFQETPKNIKRIINLHSVDIIFAKLSNPASIINAAKFHANIVVLNISNKESKYGTQICTAINVFSKVFKKTFLYSFLGTENHVYLLGIGKKLFFGDINNKLDEHADLLTDKGSEKQFKKLQLTNSNIEDMLNQIKNNIISI